MENTILIIEDEKNISDIIKFNLEKESYKVIQAFDGKIGLDKALSEKDLDLILLDVMLPSIDGFEILKKVRSESNIPIIMLTAKEEEVDKVLGLELGADDYITKPFSMRELVARVKANVRRIDMTKADQENEDMIKEDNIVIDNIKYEVRKDDKPVDLTVREFELLKFLISQRYQVFSREQLLTQVWGYEYIGDIRTVDVTVRRLREKIEDDPPNPKYIVTKRGVGYYFKGND